MDRTLVIKDIKGNIHAYSGDVLTEINLIQLSKCPPNTFIYIDPKETQKLNTMYNRFASYFEKLDTPAKIVLKDGTCWYFNEDVSSNFNVGTIGKDIIVISGCFNGSTFEEDE